MKELFLKTAVALLAITIWIIALGIAAIGAGLVIRGVISVWGFLF